MQFTQNWRGAPKSSLRIVTKGFHWKWKDAPPPLQRPPFSVTRIMTSLSQIVASLLHKKNIYPVPNQPAFLSHIFTVPKGTDSRRLIIDLSKLNQLIECPTFRMTIPLNVAEALSVPAWGGAIDLQDAYLHIPIRQNLHRYLAFYFQNQLYFFQVFPFGLNVAPLIFTRILKWPLANLRIERINTVAYLNDWMVWDNTKENTSQALQFIILYLQNLGFIINMQKSHLSPIQLLPRFGLIWDLRQGRWSLHPDRIRLQSNLIKDVLADSYCSRKKWELVQGHLIFVAHYLSHLRPLLQPVLRSQWLSKSRPTSHNTHLSMR